MTMTHEDLHDALRLAATAVGGAAARRLPSDRLLVPGPAVGPDAAPAPAEPSLLRADLVGDVGGHLHLVVGADLAAALGDGAAAAAAFADVASALDVALGIAVDAGPVTVPDTIDADESTVAIPLFDDDRLAATLLVTVAGVEAATASALAVSAPSTAAPSSSLGLLHQVEMGVTVELGRARLTVRELLALAPGSVVELDRTAGAPVDVLVNGTLLARGEVVVVDDEFAVRISEIVSGGADS